MYSIAKFIENYIAVTVLQGQTGNDVTLSADNTFTTALLRSGLQKFLDAFEKNPQIVAYMASNDYIDRPINSTWASFT